VRLNQGALRGALCIAAPPELAVWLTERLFAAYLAQHPHVRLALKLEYGFADLFDPEIDLAFRIGTVKDETMVARVVGAFRRILVAGRELSQRCPRDVTELATVPCLSFSERESTSSWILTDGEKVVTTNVDGRYSARSYAALIAAARAGLGVVHIPDFVAAPYLERGELVQVFPQWSSPEQTVFLLHRVGHQRTRRVAALLELMAERPDCVPSSAVLPRGARSAATAGRRAQPERAARRRALRRP
jgi:DNA-binding transcriptional LysR family regulator